MTLLKFRNDRLNTPRVFNDVLEDFFNRDLPSVFAPLQTSMPAVNVAETKDGYRVEMALPGWKEDNINIHLEGNMLTVSGQHEDKTNEDGEQYTRREFRSTSFSRTFTLPETVNAEQIAADFNGGVLTINVPKREEAKQKGPKTIQIGKGLRNIGTKGNQDGSGQSRERGENQNTVQSQTGDGKNK